MKLVFDVACLIFSAAVSLIFTRRLSTGIGIGTVISALLTGPVSGLYISLIQKKIRFRA